MNRFLRTLVLSALLLALPGCGPSGLRGLLVVEVDDAVTMQALPAARVVARPLAFFDFSAPRTTSATTNAQGLASLDLSPYWRYMVMAYADGYVDRGDFKGVSVDESGRVWLLEEGKAVPGTDDGTMHILRMTLRPVEKGK